MGLGLDFRILDVRLEGEVGMVGYSLGGFVVRSRRFRCNPVGRSNPNLRPFQNPKPLSSCFQGRVHSKQAPPADFLVRRHQTIHKGTLSTVKRLKEQQQTVSAQYLP